MVKDPGRTCSPSGDDCGVVADDSPAKTKITAVHGLFARCVFDFNYSLACGEQLIREIASRLIIFLTAFVVACSLTACTKEAKEKQETVKPKPAAPKAQEFPPMEPAAPVPQTPESLKAKGGWTVQVGAFVQKENASGLIETLRTKGYKAYAVEAVIKGQNWHRVRLGQFSTKQEAQTLQETLNSMGGFRDAIVVSRETEAVG